MSHIDIEKEASNGNLSKVLEYISAKRSDNAENFMQDLTDAVFESSDAGHYTVYKALIDFCEEIYIKDKIEQDFLVQLYNSSGAEDIRCGEYAQELLDKHNLKFPLEWF